MNPDLVDKPGPTRCRNAVCTGTDARTTEIVVSRPVRRPDTIPQETWQSPVPECRDGARFRAASAHGQIHVPQYGAQVSAHPVGQVMQVSGPQVGRQLMSQVSWHVTRQVFLHVNWQVARQLSPHV